MLFWCINAVLITLFCRELGHFKAFTLFCRKLAIVAIYVFFCIKFLLPKQWSRNFFDKYHVCSPPGSGGWPLMVFWKVHTKVGCGFLEKVRRLKVTQAKFHSILSDLIATKHIFTSGTSICPTPYDVISIVGALREDPLKLMQALFGHCPNSDCTLLLTAYNAKRSA